MDTDATPPPRPRPAPARWAGAGPLALIAGAGVATLAACSGGGRLSATATTSTRRRPPAAPQAPRPVAAVRARAAARGPSRRSRRPLPRRRVERGPTSYPRTGSSGRTSVRTSARPPAWPTACRWPSTSGGRCRLRLAAPRPPSTCGIATRRAATRSTPRRHRRELPRGRPSGRRRRHPELHGGDSRPPTPGGGPTSTFGAGSVDEATGGGPSGHLPDRPCPRTSATPSTPPTATPRDITDIARTSLGSDNVFGDDGAVDQLATVTGTVADGLVASLPSQS